MTAGTTGLRQEFRDRLLRQELFENAGDDRAEDDERHRLPEDGGEVMMKSRMSFTGTPPRSGGGTVSVQFAEGRGVHSSGAARSGRGDGNPAHHRGRREDSHTDDDDRAAGPELHGLAAADANADGRTEVETEQPRRDTEEDREPEELSQVACDLDTPRPPAPRARR